MFELIKLNSTVTLSEQQQDGSYSDIAYEYSIADSNGVFKLCPCHADYDILQHNKDYILQQLWWKRKHSLPSIVTVNGNQFDVNCKNDLREKCESSLYADEKPFAFKCVSGMVQLTQSTAQEVRDEIERQTQIVFDKFFSVESAINELTMKTVTTFNLDDKWEGV